MKQEIKGIIIKNEFKKINSIKEVRSFYAVKDILGEKIYMGLKDAKEAVELVMEEDPCLKVIIANDYPYIKSQVKNLEERNTRLFNKNKELLDIQYNQLNELASLKVKFNMADGIINTLQDKIASSNTKVLLELTKDLSNMDTAGILNTFGDVMYVIAGYLQDNINS